MKISNFEVQKLSLPFKQSFSHALATRNKMASILLIVKSDVGLEGFGEATPRSYVTGEDLEECIHFLNSYLEEKIPFSIESLDDIQTLLAEPELVGRPSAMTALEMALLDLLGKKEARTAQSYFGPCLNETLTYSAVITSDSLEKARKLLSMAAAFSMKSVKLKFDVDLQLNISLVSLAKDLIPDAELRADANASWSLSQALEQIPILAKMGVSIFEQPMPVSAKAEYPLLVEKLNGIADIMIDESLLTIEDAKWFIENRGADRMLLKISKNGGILATLDLARFINSKGYKVHLGSHVGESSLLSAAGRIVTAHFPFETIEGSFGTLLLEEDVCAHSLQFGKQGKAAALYSDLPGLGISVRPDFCTV